jgi:hypothetical protein
MLTALLAFAFLLATPPASAQAAKAAPTVPTQIAVQGGHVPVPRFEGKIGQI